MFKISESSTLFIFESISAVSLGKHDRSHGCNRRDSTFLGSVAPEIILVKRHRSKNIESYFIVWFVVLKYCLKNLISRIEFKLGTKIQRLYLLQS